jgi:transcriptional regulator with PAS, ATPase and Fis domain
LFYRLSVFELVIPPLRERGSDIEVLVNHFLDHLQTDQHGRPPHPFARRIGEAPRLQLARATCGNCAT